MATFTIDSGTLIKADDAASMLQTYMSQHGIDPTDPTQDVVYGYAFGLNKLKTLIQEIDTYNSTAPSNRKVIGVRVYKCANTFEGKDFEDVFLIPIIDKTTDLYPVRISTNITQTTPNIILDGSTPCPNFC